MFCLVQAAPFHDLPSALFLHILSFLPLNERVRCALVAHSWAALLTETAFWAVLSFDGAASLSVGDEALLQLCQRAGPSLQTLDVAYSACLNVTLDGLIAALALDGVGRSLATLRTWAPTGKYPEEHPAGILDLAHTATLRAACPALASAAVSVRGSLADVSAMLRSLPGPGPKWVQITGPGVTWAELTEWLPAALAASSISTLGLSYADTAVGTEQGAARVAEALAAPGRGVRCGASRCPATCLVADAGSARRRCPGASSARLRRSRHWKSWIW